MPPVVPTPNVPINFVHAKAGEIIKLGTITLRVMEDGSRTGGLFYLIFSSSSFKLCILPITSQFGQATYNTSNVPVLSYQALY
jgi:hypothetical protein